MVRGDSTRHGSSEPAFAGFPARPQSTPIPNVFFTDVMPHLADPVALGVTLFAIHALTQKKGFPRHLQPDELAAQPGLAAYLANAGADDVSAAIQHGLHRAVEVGVLHALSLERDGAAIDLYFLNSPADRRGMDAVANGLVDAPGRVIPFRRDSVAKPGIFALYESLIGTVSPLIADELAEAERLYPPDWIEEAFREAAAQNARSWRYISRILERWASEGRGDETTTRLPAGKRYFRGKYGRILRDRLDD